MVRAGFPAPGRILAQKRTFGLIGPATMVFPPTETEAGCICTSVNRAVKVGIPAAGGTWRQICGRNPVNGVLRTSDFGRVCCRSLKTEEREPKASTGDDGRI